MNRPIHALLFRVALLLAISVASQGCEDNLVGRICDLGQTPKPGEVVIASPSLDCVSRTCLRVPLNRALPPGSQYPEGNQGLCTAECSSDSDCDRVPESPCKSGFTCGVANAVGTLCCRKVCICKDYFLIPSTNEGCDPNNVNNACCNLKGRAGNPLYPACK
jgi:hypothetical protein